MATFAIPISKAGANIDVDVDALPEEMYAQALKEGLKVMLSKGMSKITTKDLEGEELAKARAAALEKAQENLAAMNGGTYKIGRAKSATTGKVSGATMTEARRLARNVVKDTLRKAGYKISLVAASDITAAANKLIDSDPSYIEQAKANLEARTAAPVGIDLTALVHEDPKKKAAAEKRKAEAKGQLSAKQAGMTAKVAGKAKPPAQATLN